MSKQSDREHIPVMGFFHPHAPVNWDGMVPDPKTGELKKEPSMTKQSFKEECDINNIIREFGVTGIATHVRQNEGLYVDLPDPLDYQQAIDLARGARTAFDALPAQVRARFENDPEQFLSFMADPSNQEEMIKLGLAKDLRPGPEPAPQKVEVVNLQPGDKPK